MGILEVLLIIFIILKLTHDIDWSWWVVLIPLYIDIVIYAACWGLIISLVKKLLK